MSTQITPPRVNFIDPNTGQISRPWYLFFLSLYDATGAGGANISLDDLLIGPPPVPSVNYEELASILAQIDISGIQPSYQHVTSDEVVHLPSDDVSLLSDKIDGLSLAPVTQPEVLPTIGRAVLVAGTVTVSNPNVTATSNIFITSQLDGGTPGWLRVSARTPGASFTITSSSATDTSTIAYQIH